MLQLRLDTHEAATLAAATRRLKEPGAFLTDSETSLSLILIAIGFRVEGGQRCNHDYLSEHLGYASTRFGYDVRVGIELVTNGDNAALTFTAPRGTDICTHTINRAHAGNARSPLRLRPLPVVVTGARLHTRRAAQ